MFIRLQLGRSPEHGNFLTPDLIPTRHHFEKSSRLGGVGVLNCNLDVSF